MQGKKPLALALSFAVAISSVAPASAFSFPFGESSPSALASESPFVRTSSVSENSAGDVLVTETSSGTLSSDGETPLKPEVSSGELIVVFKKERVDLQKNRGLSLMATTLSKNGLEVEEKAENRNATLVSFDENADVQAKAATLASDPNVLYVQPNYVYPLLSTPSDAHFSKLWGLKNSGQSVNGTTGTSGADTDFTLATDISSGSVSVVTGSLVGIIDDGVAYAHPDLAANMWDGSSCKSSTGGVLGGCVHGYDFWDNDKNPAPSIGDTHGTHIAGTIGAVADTVGVVGMNPKAKIVALRAGLNGGISTMAAVQALAFAKHNGIRIVNASWGGYFNTPIVDRALYDGIKDFGDAGGIFVTSAGNAGKDHDSATANSRMFPSGFSVDNALSAGGTLTGLTSIVSVAATTQSDDIANFSDYGATSVHIGAPGVNIYSAVPGESEKDKVLLSGMLPGQTPAALTKTGSGWVAAVASNVLMADPSVPLTRNNTTSIQRSADTSALASPALRFNVWCDTRLSANFDRLFIDFSTGGTFVSQGYVDEAAIYTYDDSYEIKLDESSGSGYARTFYLNTSSYKSSNFSYRFRWTSDGNDDTDGTYYHRGCLLFDDVAISDSDNGTSGAYAFKNGTSMASPQVAGALSLAWSYRPDLSAAAVRSALLSSGDPIGALSGKTTSGKRLNTYRLLESVASPQASSMRIVRQDSSIAGSGAYVSGSGGYRLEWTEPTNAGTLSSRTVEFRTSTGALAYSGSASTNAFTGSALSEGTYSAVVTLTNEMGGSGSSSFGFSVDATGPTKPVVTSPVSGLLKNSNSADFSWNSVSDAKSGLAAVRIELLSFTGTVVRSYVSSGSSSAGSLQATGIPDGNYVWNVYGTDAMGNVGTSSTGTLGIDTVAPNSPSGVSFPGTSTVTVVNEDSLLVAGSGSVADSGATVSVSVRSSSGAGVATAAGVLEGNSFSVPVDVSLLSDGTLTASVTFTDAYGNVSQTGTATVSKSSSSTPQAYFASGAYVSSGTTKIALSSPYAVDYAISGTGIVSAITGSLSAGASKTEDVILTALDGAKTAVVEFSLSGSTVLTLTKSTKLDTVAPVISVLSQSGSVEVPSASLFLSGTATDANGVSAVSVAGNSAVGTSSWSKTVSLGAYENSFEVFAADPAGNVSSVTVSAVRVPVVTGLSILFDSNSGATATVSTDIPAFHEVRFGTDSGSLSQISTGSLAATSSQLALSGDFSGTGTFFFKASASSGAYLGVDSSLLAVSKDTSPDAVSFPDLLDQNASTQVFSAARTISGVNAPTTIRIDNGEYSLDSGAYSSYTGTVRQGQSVVLRTTSPAAGASKIVTLYVGDKVFTLRVVSKTASAPAVSGGGSSGGGSSGGSTGGGSSSGGSSSGAGSTSPTVTTPTPVPAATPAVVPVPTPAQPGVKTNPVRKKNVPAPAASDVVGKIAKLPAMPKMKAGSSIANIPKTVRPQIDRLVTNPVIKKLALEKKTAAQKAVALEKAAQAIAKQVKTRKTENEKTVLKYVSYQLSKKASDYRKLDAKLREAAKKKAQASKTSGKK